MKSLADVLTSAKLTLTFAVVSIGLDSEIVNDSASSVTATSLIVNVAVSLSVMVPGRVRVGDQRVRGVQSDRERLRPSSTASSSVATVNERDSPAVPVNTNAATTLL